MKIFRQNFKTGEIIYFDDDHDTYKIFIFNLYVKKYILNYSNKQGKVGINLFLSINFME